jgi:hypothetical protein
MSMRNWKAAGDLSKDLANVAPDEVGSVYDEAELGVPKPGPYLATCKRLQATESKNGNPMLRMVFEIAEPKGTKKALYNGYSIWQHQVVSRDLAGTVNAFLHALFDGKPTAQRRKLIEAFWSGNVTLDDGRFVTKIGTFRIPKAILMRINTRPDSYNGWDKLKVLSVMPASDRTSSKPLDEEDEEPPRACRRRGSRVSPEQADTAPAGPKKGTRNSTGRPGRNQRGKARQ